MIHPSVLLLCSWLVLPSVAPTASDDAQREERRAADRLALDEALAAMRAYDAAGVGTTFSELVARAGQLAEQAGDATWTSPGVHGSLRTSALARFAAWNRPVSDGEGPLWSATSVPNHCVPVIVDFARQLREQGVELLFAPVPHRFQIEPERIPGVTVGDGFAGFGQGVLECLRLLSEQGVEVVDLITPMARRRAVRPDDRLFLDDNVHWTSRGAELAAEVVAARLAKVGVLGPGPMREGEHFLVSETVHTFDRFNSDPPPDARPQSIPLAQVFDENGKRLLATDDASPLLVLGDSFPGFLASESTDFATHLMRYSGHKVDLIGIRGGGMLSCRDALRRRRNAFEGKRVAVWLFAAASLVPHRQWRSVKMVRGKR